MQNLVKNDGQNLAWFPFHVIPWFKSPLPLVTTVHDLSFMIKPQSSGLITSLYFTAALANTLWRSRRVIVISEATAEDILRYFPWAKTKICIAKHGLPDDCRELSEQLQVEGSFALRKPSAIKILFLDGGNARKRFDAALRACAILKHDFPLELVVTGNRDAVMAICYTTLGEIPDFVKPLGQLPRPELLRQFASANVLAYLSRYEGFGFPIIEGMSLGAQVVTLKGRAEMEVGGNMAIYSKSDAAEDIAHAVACAAKKSFDSKLRDGIVNHANSFSWDKSAKTHAEAFRQATF